MPTTYTGWPVKILLVKPTPVHGILVEGLHSWSRRVAGTSAHPHTLASAVLLKPCYKRAALQFGSTTCLASADVGSATLVTQGGYLAT